VVMAGADREEPLPDTRGRQQQQQQPWHLLDLTMPHAVETDVTTQGEESSSQSPGGEYGCADVMLQCVKSSEVILLVVLRSPVQDRVSHIKIWDTLSM
jgi:hypothetical protein